MAAATGDLVLKMDDDDWYAPDFVADLLRARAYSGADLVGTADEFYYLAERDLTVQRRHPGERYSHWVAGGTLMVDPSLLREAGGFPSVREARRPPADRRRSSPWAARSTAPTASVTSSAATPRDTRGEVDMEELLDPFAGRRLLAGLPPLAPPIELKTREPPTRGRSA